MNNIIETIQRHTPESERSWCLPAPARTDGSIKHQSKGGVCVFVGLDLLFVACVRDENSLGLGLSQSRQPRAISDAEPNWAACCMHMIYSYINNAIILSLC